MFASLKQCAPGSSSGRTVVFDTTDGLGSNPPPGARKMNGRRDEKRNDNAGVGAQREL